MIGFEKNNIDIVGCPKANRSSPIKSILQHQINLAPQLLVQYGEGKGKNALGIQAMARFPQTLDGVDKRIQSHARSMAKQSMGIQQAIDHQVVLLVGSAQERASVAHDCVNAWIEIRMFGMS